MLCDPVVPPRVCFCGHSARGGLQTAGSKPKVAGVRFASSQSTEGAHSHVHFDEKLHDSLVMVTQEKDGNFLVKVGFLKILHKYEITFLLPPVPRLGKDVCAAPVPNLNLKVISITPVSEGKSTHFQGGQCPGNVPDRHHGTPMLLEGVRCIGSELEYDSEHSDWPGFD
uniref:Adipose-secreted signaling protein n=1 Tax=Sphenodon punctatus TaxID=8508 RepID=A0A8D0LA27_SPHPU